MTPSLRSIAKELEVSHSYLSQVLHGKRPASEKVLTTLLTSGLLKPLNTHAQNETGTPGETRTHDTRFRKPLVYPLAYWGMRCKHPPYKRFFRLMSPQF